ncbi:MAG: nitrilase family protein [Chloroflexota bacterium]
MVDEVEASARKRRRETMVRVAAAQLEPHVGDKTSNVHTALTALRRAVDAQVDLIVLPELSNSGYIFHSRAEAFGLSEPVPDGPTCLAYLKAIEGTRLHVVAGVCERDGNRLYNTAVFLGPDGYIGKYRKLHLWNEEKLFFEPGNLGLPLFHLPFGRVGILICYDAWFPEVIRILKLQGADIICDPTCWDLMPGLVDESNNLMPPMHMGQAHMNNVFMICADRCGIERGCTFAGSSCIVGPAGYVAGPASFSDEDFLTADINLLDARHHHWSEYSDPIADRRVDVYAADLGYRPPIGLV